MPHTKRKAKVKEITSTPLQSIRQPRIEEVFAGLMQLQPEGGAVGGISGEQPLSPLAIETSLSPGAPITPEAPFKKLEPEVNIAALLERKSAFQGGEPQRGGEEAIITSVSSEPTSSRGLPMEALQQGSEGNSFLDIGARRENEIRVVCESPNFDTSKVTLEQILKAISAMEKSIISLTNMVKESIQQSQVLEKRLEKNETLFTGLEKRVTETEKIQINLIKSENIQMNKMENLENLVRRNNIRILNFPKLRLLSHRELLRSYFINILKIAEPDLPKIIKIYYLPHPNKEGDSTQKQKMEDSFDLTSILEKSCELIVEERATLFVQLDTSVERDLILKLFFRNQAQKFYGYLIKIFPDVTKLTQIKRKKFLEMRGEVLARGARFILRFPCYCLILFKEARYKFREPEQLRVYLNSHSN